MLIASLLIVLAFSIYFYVSTKSASHDCLKSLGKCVPMVLGMTSSVTVGLVIGIWIPSLLAIATILSIIISSCLSFFFVKRFGQNGIIEAQASSFMGAMMGAMLGVMLTSPLEAVIMLIASNLSFIISTTFMIVLLNKGTTQKRVFSKRIEYFALIVLSLVVISGMGVRELGGLGNSNYEHIEQEMMHDHSH
ncbi:hypothetical protein SAMN05421503_2563 [Terribacillus aidingensis]|uniref:Uncharacterized protein n=1 Tax=Terribacillus aidingensis TaxID=586416 RepID=A0A285P0E6_9BACI|nr:hypothetical protein [Terribacillus aidingensis]SNZ14747.1 hypothetical protein SAMN05421503_2563 [Terribacillus aidingensis]